MRVEGDVDDRLKDINIGSWLRQYLAFLCDMKLVYDIFHFKIEHSAFKFETFFFIVIRMFNSIDVYDNIIVGVFRVN